MIERCLNNEGVDAEEEDIEMNAGYTDYLDADDCSTIYLRAEVEAPNSVRFSGGKLVKIDVVRSALQHYRSTQSKSRPVSSMRDPFGFVVAEEDLKKLRQFERGNYAALIDKINFECFVVDFPASEIHLLLKIIIENMESYEKFSLLLRELDELIDDDLLEKSWQHYETIGQQIILEGEQKSWMACAFYATVWQSTPMGAQEPVFKYSISKLLDICNLSILEFFEKLNKWAEMILAKGRLLEHINLLQDNLASSTVVYKNFLKIFRFIFQKPSLPSPNRPQPSSVLDISQIFQFTWVTFVSLKPFFANDKADFLNELCLLFCVLEAILVDVRDMLLADLMLSLEFVMSVKDGVTHLESICKFFGVPYLDAKHFQTYQFLPRVLKLVADGVLQGNALLGNYQRNRAALELLYEEHMKKRVVIDQRILMANASDEDIFDQTRDADVIEILRKSAVESELLTRRYIQKSMEELGVRSEDNITKSDPMMYVDTRIYVEQPDYTLETYKNGLPGIEPLPSGQYNAFSEDISILDRFGVKRKHEMIL